MILNLRIFSLLLLCSSCATYTISPKETVRLRKAKIKLAQAKQEKEKIDLKIEVLEQEILACRLQEIEGRLKMLQRISKREKEKLQPKLEEIMLNDEAMLIHIIQSEDSLAYRSRKVLISLRDFF